jgi:hypothetical protein
VYWSLNFVEVFLSRKKCGPQILPQRNVLWDRLRKGNRNVS